MPELHVLRVFVNEDGEWGNPLGVFLEGSAVPESARERVAAELGFSETVFVDDPLQGEIRIHTPAVELPFAGHPTVGTAWLLGRLGRPVEALKPPAGEVPVRSGDGIWWIDARPEWAPPFEYRQLATPAEVRALAALPAGAGNLYAWAWIDEAAGTVRARSFVPDAGVAEDEATGSAALVLSARLGRPLAVHQGHGSLLLTRPTANGRAEVGGHVHLDEVRDWPLPPAP
ncbi:MAG TPA: PhzF family phenazine biosynthesis protein [Solirubrobacterales bacterium]|nr:PhzF family phenazine biosynthesis protein [Solirubrobacterales bacterium]